MLNLVDKTPLSGRFTSNFDGDTYRTVYTVQLKGMIYVLRAFQKKSNEGNKTSLNYINKIKARLKTAIELQAEREDEQSKKHKAVTFSPISACPMLGSISQKLISLSGLPRS
jgi:hypothetical protein